MRSMTLETAVSDLYRAILGRDPESAAVVQEHAAKGSVEAVARDLVHSEEYRQLHGGGFTLHRCYDFSLFVPVNDWMYESVVSNGYYEPYVIGAFREACRSARVLDVGANIGLFSIVAAKVTDKTVTAVDISPVNAKFIAMNASHNRIENIEIFPVAASAQMGTIKSHGVHSNKVVHHSAVTPETFAHTDISFSVPLDMIVHDKVDVLKIDVEGHEYPALLGCRAILDGKPTVFMEFSPAFMRDVSGVEPGAVLGLFFDRGYRATILHRDMTQEHVGQSEQALVAAWGGYRERGITHLDLMLKV